ncbi:MAG: hypothetical protein WBW53_20190 [Terriglobales bacterium]
MSTTWKSGDQKSSKYEKSTNCKASNKPTNNAIVGTALTSWSRQQKLAMLACFAILGVLLVISACSKQSTKPVAVGVSGPAPAVAPPTATVPVAAQIAAPAPVKKVHRRRPANVTYSDTNYGVSFLYPRKFTLMSGDKAQPQLAETGDVPMNFAEPGGVTVATVELPGNSFPGTDFESAFFSVSVNRNVSEQECEHFAFTDTRNADGEPVDAEKVKIGSTEMETTSDFSASDIKQDETQYYHNYANGACYEYTIGLGTEGFGTVDGIEHVNRDEVFAKLEKILATVKVNPVAQEPAAEQTAGGNGGGK